MTTWVGGWDLVLSSDLNLCVINGPSYPPMISMGGWVGFGPMVKPIWNTQIHLKHPNAMPLASFQKHHKNTTLEHGKATILRNTEKYEFSGRMLTTPPPPPQKHHHKTTILQTTTKTPPPQHKNTTTPPPQKHQKHQQKNTPHHHRTPPEHHKVAKHRKARVLRWCFRKGRDSTDLNMFVIGEFVTCRLKGRHTTDQNIFVISELLTRIFTHHTSLTCDVSERVVIARTWTLFVIGEFVTCRLKGRDTTDQNIFVISELLTRIITHHTSLTCDVSEGVVIARTWTCLLSASSWHVG